MPNKKISYWLFLNCFLILSMVVVGGLTRLTESGLSITQWKPIHGTLPPISAAEWKEEFEQYKSSPQYKKVNYGMKLSEFKYIFWWEYFHRLLGRLVGLFYLLPLIYFLVKKEIPFKDSPKFFALFLLGGLQGLVGWLMVKSGLVDNPAVSHFRLALHLSLALILFSFIFWQALEYSGVKSEQKPEYKNIKNLCDLSIILLFIQIIYGAFVAGLDAGMIYNTWPKMDEDFIPDNSFSNGVHSAITDIAAIQFIHRWLAFVVFAAIIILLVKIKKLVRAGKIGSKPRIWINIAHILVFTQIILGIFTLVYQVPITLAALHQANAVLLLASLVYTRKVIS